MNKAALVIVLFVFLGLSQPFFACAEEAATPQECIQKVRDAAEYLRKEGQEGVSTFMDKEGKYVWKDSYIFLMDCNKMEFVAHPINPKLLGKNMAGLKDIKGNYFFIQFCERSREPRGGWVEYWWPKPNDKKLSRKISYVIQVPGSPLMAGAGIFDNALSVDDLDKLLK